MKLNKVVIGDMYVDSSSGEMVRVIDVKITKHYGPGRPVRIRYPDKTTAYVGAELLDPCKTKLKTK